jgi:acetolactate synthase-1/2/3 large subunit
MNGAESLLRTLVGAGLRVCFANPGTSEMHFVAALDRVGGMRGILGVFEGVVTGAADGYARMTGVPAVTLLHLGPGMANGLANMHNARRALSPMVNIVGDHASYHRRYNAPLTSDIEAAARPFSDWVRTASDALNVAADGAAAVAAARTPPGRIATLILPADAAWNTATGPCAVAAPGLPARPSGQNVLEAAAALRSGEPALLLLGGRATRADGLDLAGRICARTGARLRIPFCTARTEHGRGRVPVESIPYGVDQALAALTGIRHFILVGTEMPVAFFAYPDRPNLLYAPDAQEHVLAHPDQDLIVALEWLADELDARAMPAPLLDARAPQPATGPFAAAALGESIAALLPENAIVSDESLTIGRGFFAQANAALPHDWLSYTGGSIGLGMPLATGAAVACPDRKVVSLQADGSALYTLQSLWTQAREGLAITTVLFSNRSYAILRDELAKVGAGVAGSRALDLLDLGRPDIDWVGVARSLGVPGARVTDMEQFNRRFAEGLALPGPYLVEVVL